MIVSDNKRASVGVSNWFAIEACWAGYNPSFWYIGDSSPELDWLPEQAMKPNVAQIKG